MVSPVVELASVRNLCQQCGLYKLCLPVGLGKTDLDQLDHLIKRRRSIPKGDYLYRAGEPFTLLYALRSGSAKTLLQHSSGMEHVIGFKLPGDLLGLSAINGNHYTNSAIALETSSVCEIPFTQLESLSRTIPGLQHHVLELMSREIQAEHEKVAVCSKLSAEARLASLLLTLSDRFHQRGYSAQEFNLSMSRSDIANLLGLAVETVSRLFTQFEQQQLLLADRKHIKILNMHTLSTLVEMIQ
ncbi:MAG: fumarate/nitrate reduction transcriptional regulator Fnr [Gammaproteobacteria bacterium]|nr:fumarate/nitrate reduction transcriptional regulator Fnr [Gammaproteobacteria bacterium]